MKGKKGLLVAFASVAVVGSGGWFAFDQIQKHAVADALHQSQTNIRLCADALNAPTTKVEYATVYANFQQTYNLMKQYGIDPNAVDMGSVAANLRKNFDFRTATPDETHYARLIMAEAAEPSLKSDYKNASFLATLTFADARNHSNLWNEDFAQADRLARSAIELGNKQKARDADYLKAVSVLAGVADVRYNTSLTRVMGKELRQDVLQAEEAARLVLQSYDSCDMAQNQPLYCEALDRLATCEQMLGKFDDAQEHLELAMKYDRTIDPKKAHERLGFFRTDLANIYIKQKQWAKAAPLLHEILEEYERNPKSIDNPIQIYDNLIKAEEKLNHPALAKKLKEINHQLKKRRHARILAQ